MNKIFFICGFALFAVACSGSQLNHEQEENANAPSISPTQHAKLKELGEAMVDNEEIRNYLLTAKKPEDVYQMAADLQRDGKPRMKDSDLEERVKLLASIVDKLGEENCANLITPTAPTINLPVQRPLVAEMVDLLSPNEANALVSWMQRAALASIHKDPLIVNNPETSQKAFRVFLDSLSKDDAERLVAVLSNSTSSKQDNCWAAKVIYKNVLTLKQPERTILIREINR